MGKLGVYWSVMHRRAEDYQYFKDIQPSVFKIMDGGDPDYKWARDNLPNSFVLARDWALSEQSGDMLRDPVGTGQRHAHEWSDHQKRLGFDKDKTFILGINEPHIWEAGIPEALRLYTIAMCEEATKLGLRVGAMQLSVGWPNNTGPGTVPDWSPWLGVEQAIINNRGVLVCHEYWADGGPTENWGWWGGRSLKCPWNVPIVIGECGVDMFVKDVTVGQQNRGWLGHMPAERYAAELSDYTYRMSADPRFLGCCVFASDFAAHEWYSFDLYAAYKAITAINSGEVDTPFIIHLPYVPASDQYADPTAVVDVPDGANIRVGPGMAYERLGAEPVKTPLLIIGRTEASDWWKVNSRFGNGWVSDTAVQPYNTLNVPVVVVSGDKPPDSQDSWTRSRAFVSRWEGGFQNYEWDAGNWTGCKQGQGENKGTNFGISACSYPSLDIFNITMHEADDLYFHDYWMASGANALAWPYCLLVFDTAVLHGVAVAKDWLSRYGADMDAFVARRLSTYVQSDMWNNAGNAWVRRVSELLIEATKK